MHGISYWIVVFALMPQLSDFHHEVIVLFKKEHATWSLRKCREVLPVFFGEITTDQYKGLAAALKSGKSPAAKKRKHGAGTSCTHNTPTKRAVLERFCIEPFWTPTNRPDHRKQHSSQRQICKELGVSKGFVYRTIKKSDLKCYRRVKFNVLTEAHQQARKIKCNVMLPRFEAQQQWKQMWFSDEASFSVSAPLNRQNERFYRAVEVKTDISDDNLLVEIDKQTQSMLFYGVVSWYSKNSTPFY